MYDLHIVKMDETHLDVLAELERQCFSAPWSKRALQTELLNKDALFYVALLGQNITGYAGMYHYGEEGYITNIAVFEPYRGKGIAKGLVDQLIEYGLFNKMSFLSLEVRKSNHAAIRLYENKGFTKQGERKNFYSNPTENALIFTYFFNREKNN